MLDSASCRRIFEGDSTDAARVLAPLAFDDAATAAERVRSLGSEADVRESLARLLPPLLFALSESATPDTSLMNFQRFAQAVGDRAGLFAYLAEHPRAVEILVRLFVGSQFLTEILLRNPAYLEQLTEHKRLAEFKHRQEMFDEGRAAAEAVEGSANRLNALRRWQQWELLRLAACDSFGLMDLKTVTLQLALLADALVQNCLRIVLEDLGASADDFAVLGFGKLGGEELNYSSDIDLVFVCEQQAERYWALGQRLIKAISEPTGDGFLYRVDMRLRPWGRSGPLVTTVGAYANYLKSHGQLWEKQALLKARVIAGSEAVGQELLTRLQPIIFDVTEDEARANVREMKQRIESNSQNGGRGWGDVKGGEGSIRDVEFVTQFLQLAHGKETPAVRSANTLDGLVRLADFDILHGDEYRQLTTGYVFLRTVEHALQLMHNKQVHTLPTNERELAYLARRLDFPGTPEFVQHCKLHSRSIRRVYDKYIRQSAHDPAAPKTEAPTVASHLGEAAASYAELFSVEQAARHLALLDQLGDSTPLVIDRQAQADDAVELTVVGFDHIGDLSLMCGLLFVHGFNIESGYAFTGDEVAAPRSTPERSRSTRRQRPAPRRRSAARRRKYVNVFRVRAERTPPADVWRNYDAELGELLELSRRVGQSEAQGQLAKRVASVIQDSADKAGALMPVEIDIDNESVSTATVMHIRADDTPGFFYELTNALALSGVSIQRVWIRSQGERVIDTLWVVDDRHQRIEDPDRIKELRAAVVLIKHFTHLLPQSSNPEAALLHFREFLAGLFEQPDWVRDLGSLHNSQVLEALARLLGVSEFLWHDFLRLQHSNLFPIVADVKALQEQISKAALQAKLDGELEAATSLDARRDLINAFKDREMLRVDMRHILELQDKFGMFGQELTDVAEVIVAATCRVVLDELHREFGRPQLPDGTPCHLSVCALGKCGGAELGFASDIELLFVFAGDGTTDGPNSISNTEFFQKLVDGFRTSIRAKRKGIFEIDLRLRPYGKAGSPAVTLETFSKYFGWEGPAWPYERQALVKLRPIAGDAGFGERVVAARDAICFSGRPFDVQAMRGMREKQLRQLVKAGAFNAKLSPGGLVDCEYFVQGLQMTYGHLSPRLRVANTREALKGLEAEGILTSEERVRLRDAYRFLRRVIDGLRMVRGDARDLAVPSADSEQFEFLARRLGYGKDTRKLSLDLEHHTGVVREMTKRLDELPGQVRLRVES